MKIVVSLTVNQILVACLILILVVFLIFVGRLVAELIGLMKNTKKLVASGQNLVDKTNRIMDDTETKLTNAADNIIKSASPTSKAVVAVAGVVVALNLGNQIRKHMLEQGGFVAHMVDKKARKKTKKQIIKSKRELKRIKSNTKAEKKMAKEARKIAKEAKNID